MENPPLIVIISIQFILTSIDNFKIYRAEKSITKITTRSIPKATAEFCTKTINQNALKNMLMANKWPMLFGPVP